MADFDAPDGPTRRATRPDLTVPRRYRVRIHYREPTYAQYRGLDDPTYTVVYEVIAHDDDAAEASARARFTAAVRAESVGWTREIVRIEFVADA